MISVIIPAKDAEQTLGECLQAMLHQDNMQFGHDYEVIVVDDGSTDRTAEIAENYPVCVIRQANAGPATARNKAVRNAKGNLLAFTDADCAPSPNWLVKLTHPFDEPEIVGVKGAYRTHQTDLVPRFVQLEYEYKDARMRDLPSIDFIDTFSAAYRKDVFMQNNGFDESFKHPAVEDIEFSFRLARKGYHMAFEPDATVFHQHDRNLAEYLHRKYKIGFWGAHMLHWTAEKLISDARTAFTQRLEIVLLAILLVILPFIAIWPFYASLALLAALAFFLLITSPFQAFIAKRDPQVLSIATGMLIARAGALGVGLLKGFLLPPPKSTKYPACQSIAVRAVKRMLDIIGSIVGLLLSSPVIAGAALAIRLDSPGPVLYKQPRAGEFGEPFTIFKLRTMVDGAERMVPEMRSMSHLKGPAFKIPNDPRVTRVGRTLRRWSLDELPQFWNVIKGEMSLVGPRPEVMHLVGQYTDEQRQRLVVKPGLTGPVQVHGRDELDFDQRFQLELEYLRNYSISKDIKIIFKTVAVVISGEGMV
jgi:lipopolysaccharide/colanic/teichoic acid biosynthesis glycosyltransferase/glycosyltransferase involved in cell wall biosynthesis